MQRKGLLQAWTSNVSSVCTVMIKTLGGLLKEPKIKCSRGAEVVFQYQADHEENLDHNTWLSSRSWEFIITSDGIRWMVGQAPWGVIEQVLGGGARLTNQQYLAVESTCVLFTHILFSPGNDQKMHKASDCWVILKGPWWPYPPVRQKLNQGEKTYFVAVYF